MNLESSLRPYFSNFSTHKNHLEGLLPWFLNLPPEIMTQQVWGFAPLTGSQVMLMLLVLRPNTVQPCSKGHIISQKDPENELPWPKEMTIKVGSDQGFYDMYRFGVKR